MGYKMVLVMQCAKYYILICLSFIDLNAGLLGQIWLNLNVGLLLFYS